MPTPPRDLNCGACHTGQPHVHEDLTPNQRVAAQQMEASIVPGSGRDLLRPGRWVKVWAAVIDQTGVHPEDLAVQFLTHNSELREVVRRDHVEAVADGDHAGAYPPGAPRCTSLYETDEAWLVHCESRAPAGHQHYTKTTERSYQWDDEQAHGSIEVRY